MNIFTRARNFVKRGFNFVSGGIQVDVSQFFKNSFGTKNTPTLENIYNTIATEFSKLDLIYVRKVDDKIEEHTSSNLYELLSLRPNKFLSATSWLHIVAYQLHKYGNSLTVIKRDFDDFGASNIRELEVLNVDDYLFGNGYVTDKGFVFLKLKRKKDNQIVLINYDDIIHLRLNPNDVFNGDVSNNLNDCDTLVQIFDKNLNVLFNEIATSTELRGIIQVGNSATGVGGGLNNALLNKDNKMSKQDELRERLVKARETGLLVLDAGEEWKPLTAPFKTMSKEQVDQIVKYIYNFKGINQSVIDGTATYEQMEVFFNKTIVPILEQFLEELNYKLLSKTARTQGHQIKHTRNPFEYVNIVKAVDIAYKGAMDTTTNERRDMIYNLPPIEGGDILRNNLNFESVKSEGGE